MNMGEQARHCSARSSFSHLEFKISYPPSPAGSVLRSIENPILSTEANIMGFLNMLVAARDAKVVSRFV